ncbi:unnamed protein product [Citrullus colocynthis]|uniref:Major facilitator superfamily (MFS) profile domain-containing protein n=1 Tax=Citrullus colocynthis TaxID=252529 RepID=A0ABP0Y622_9ROSI
MAMENMGNPTAISSAQFDRQTPPISAVPEKPKRNRYAFFFHGFYLTGLPVEILLGVGNIYAAIDAAIAGRTSDYIGRRYTMVLVGFIFFFGAFLMGFATIFVSFMLGQFIIGLGTGYAFVVSPVYIAEVSPTSSRGFFTSLSEMVIPLIGCQYKSFALQCSVFLLYLPNLSHGGGKAL